MSKDTPPGLRDDGTFQSWGYQQPEPHSQQDLGDFHGSALKSVAARALEPFIPKRDGSGIDYCVI